jgi:hypothetical protein
MPKLRTGIGIVGTLLFITSISILLYALNSPSQIHYSTPGYYYPPPPPPEGAGGGGGPCPSLTILVIVLGLVLIYQWKEDWKKKNKQSDREFFRQIIKWIKLNPYFSIAILTAAYLILALFIWADPYFSPKSQTVQYGELPQGGQPADYIAFAQLTGPDKLYLGTSAEITFTMWITKGVAPFQTAILLPHKTYTVTVDLQAVNFEVDNHALSSQSKQSLAVDNPAFWTWVVTPKEKRLGRQSLVVRTQVEGERALGFSDSPYLSVVIDVTDPIGLPPSIVYAAVTFGGILGVPFWAWLFSEWSTRQKEKREQKRKSDEVIKEIWRP